MCLCVSLFFCRGVPQIEVKFKVNAYGILDVTSEDKVGKKSQFIT